MDSLGTGYGRVLNMGIGGDRVEHLLWRLENGALDGYTTKFFFLLIGTNNSFQKTPCDKPEEIAAGIRRILDDIIAKHPESKVLLMPILPYEKLTDPRGAVRRANNEAVNAIIIKFADDKHVFLVDVRDQFLNADGTFKTEMYTEKMLDGNGHFLHPSPHMTSAGLYGRQNQHRHCLPSCSCSWHTDGRRSYHQSGSRSLRLRRIRKLSELYRIHRKP